MDSVHAITLNKKLKKTKEINQSIVNIHTILNTNNSDSEIPPPPKASQKSKQPKDTSLHQKSMTSSSALGPIGRTSPQRRVPSDPKGEEPASKAMTQQPSKKTLEAAKGVTGSKERLESIKSIYEAQVLKDPALFMKPSSLRSWKE